MTTRRHYAAMNQMGFDNSWEVFVFDSRRARDTYVDQHDQAIAITSRQATAYAANYSMAENRPMRPRPFTDERWMIYRWDDPSAMPQGCLGRVEVGHLDDQDSVSLY